MGIETLAISFGATGSPALLTIAEQVYAAMPVGFGSVTQDRWRCNPVTVNGIVFPIFLALDSDGRAEVLIYAAYAEAPGSNDDFATVDLQVTLAGVPQNLFGGGTTYTYNHQRATVLRWQTGAMPWQTTSAFIKAKIADGTFLRHDARMIAAAETSSATDLPASAEYQPFKTFGTINQANFIGDAPRNQTAGAERTSIGPAHEWMARFIYEVGTKGNEAWATAGRLQVLQNLAETAGQFPHASGLFDLATNRLLDPSAKPHSTHSNSNAWGPLTGIPQPSNALYDNAHPFNKFSFQAWHLSRDPFHLLEVQGQAIAALAFTTYNAYVRGVDGKTLVIGNDQERGVWWGLQTIVQAWHATPSGAMPKPFRDKAFFALAINNTLNWIREKCMNPATHQKTGALRDAMIFWRIVANLEYAGEAHGSRFQEDYGNIVLAQALLLGYSAARDVAEWRIVNLQRRLAMGGNWALNEYGIQASSASYAIGPLTGTTLPYTTVAEYKAWYPRPSTYTGGPVTAEYWQQQYGRDTYLLLAAVNVNKEAARRGLLTPGFDISAAETELHARFTPPYTYANGNPLGYTAYAKQYYSYPTAAAEEPPVDPPEEEAPPASTVPLVFVGGALGSVPMGVLYWDQGGTPPELPIGIDAAKVPLYRKTIFEGSKRVVTFEGSKRVVTFDGSKRIVEF